MSGMLKGQIVHFLTQKLANLPAFNKAVETLHGEVTFIQKEVYTQLLRATQEGDGKLPPPESKPKSTVQARVDKPQNQQLLNFIEKTKRDLKDKENS